MIEKGGVKMPKLDFTAIYLAREGISTNNDNSDDNDSDDNDSDNDDIRQAAICIQKQFRRRKVLCIFTPSTHFCIV